MTLEECYRVDNALLFSYAAAKCEYEISVKDYGEDDFLTLQAKQDMDRLAEAREIMKREAGIISDRNADEIARKAWKEVTG